MLAVVPSSFQSCVYFNTHGRVTWRVVDGDSSLEVDGTDDSHIPQRQGLEMFSVKGQVINTLSFAAQTVFVATMAAFMLFL